MFRREAACEIIRSGTSSNTPTTRAAISGSCCSTSPTAHSSDMFRSTDTDANSLSASSIAVEVPHIVHCHRHAHFGCRDHIHRRREALEDLEHLTQEPVSGEHSRRRDVDDRHVSLGGETGEPGSRRTSLRR